MNALIWAFAKLNTRERARAFFASVAALEAGRDIPDRRDIAEGERRQQQFSARPCDRGLFLQLSGRRPKPLRSARWSRPSATQFRRQFRANSVDAPAGVIKGVTVAQANIVAKGHFITLDRGGQITGDPRQVHKRLPMATDEKTLTTLMAAAKAAGGTIKTRVDHDDSIGARAGTCDNFRISGDKVLCDVSLLKAFSDRAVVLEVAEKNPELLGLSIDFTFSTDVKNGAAFVRVDTLEAVDLVDEGAITPGGLFN